MDLISHVASDYRFAQAFVVRLMGGLLVVLGLLVLLLTLALGLLGLPILLLPVGVVLVLGAIFGVGLMLRHRVAVRLGEGGYRVRMVRGAGVRQASWTDVEDVVATTVSSQRVVVVRLRDGSSTTIPVEVLGVDPDAFVRDLQQHLNRGHGYRPLR